MVSSSSSPDDDTAERAAGIEPAGDNPPGEPAEVRLQKALANAGVASRRASENLIVAGRVEVNGVVVTELGSRINPGVDTVTGASGHGVTPTASRSLTATTVAASGVNQ